MLGKNGTMTPISARLCRCKKADTIEGQALCTTCQEKNRTRAKAYRLRKVAAGLCTTVGCRNKPPPDRTLCEKHLEILRVAARQRTQTKKAAERCVQGGCNNPIAKASAALCEECWAKRRPDACSLCGSPDHHRQSDRFTIGHVKAGFCSKCEKPWTTKYNGSHFCDAHAAEMRVVVVGLRKQVSKNAVKDGLCRRCCCRPIRADSKSRCAECLDYAAKYGRKRVEARERVLKEAVRAGLCRRCGSRPIREGSKSRCAECLVYAVNYARKQSATKLEE